MDVAHFAAEGATGWFRQVPLRAARNRALLAMMFIFMPDAKHEIGEANISLLRVIDYFYA